jgi:hypothetical protein
MQLLLGAGLVGVVALVAADGVSAGTGAAQVDRPCTGALSPSFASAFAADWIASWNSHDLERILSHYTDDFEMFSPLIIERVGEPSGMLRGKKAVGAYWKIGLAASPPLRFEFIEVFTGIGSLTIHYRSVGRRMAAESLEFDASCRVIRGRAHYGGPA